MNRSARQEASTKVLICTPAAPPRVGGRESFLEVLLQSIHHLGYRVHLVSRGPIDQHIRDAVRITGGDTHTISTEFDAEEIEHTDQFFRQPHLLWQVLQDYAADVVHVLSHDGAIAAAIAARKARGGKACALVASFSETSIERSTFGEAQSEWIYALPIHGILAESGFYQHVAVRHGYRYPENISVGSAVNVGLFNGADRERGRRAYGVDRKEYLIACPSRFKVRKGQMELVSAVGRLVAGGIPIRLLLAGSTRPPSAGYVDEIRAAIRAAGIDDKVTILQRVERTGMPDFLAAADVVVQPSAYEGLGRAALEAMAVGTCTVLTKTSGFDEIAVDRRTSLMYPPGDVDRLADCLRELYLKPGLRQRLARTAKQFVNSRFTPVHLAEAVQLVYTRAIEIAEECRRAPW